MLCAASCDSPRARAHVIPHPQGCNIKSSGTLTLQNISVASSESSCSSGSMLDLQEATTINSDYPEATSTVFPLPLPAFDDTRQSCARNQNSRMPTLRAVVERAYKKTAQLRVNNQLGLTPPSTVFPLAVRVKLNSDEATRYSHPTSWCCAP